MVLWLFAAVAMRRIFEHTLWVYGGLVLLGCVGRLLPHAPNATPMTAIAVAASRRAGPVAAAIIPLLAMLAADFVLGFYDLKILASVYFSFALIGLVGYMMRRHTGPIATMCTVGGGTLLFFLLTNGAVWAFSPWYEKSVWGLLYAYELGLPFLRNMIIGDMLYAFAIFGALKSLPRAVARISGAGSPPSSTAGAYRL